MTEDWRELAKCKGMDPNLFFPERGDAKQVSWCKTFCSTCPVRQECLDYASTYAIDTGIWGGEGSRGIRANRRRMGIFGVRRPRELTHGTAAGYNTHRRRHEKPCEQCARAHNLHTSFKRPSRAKRD